jgi:hypothetical protein
MLVDMNSVIRCMVVSFAFTGRLPIIRLDQTDRVSR